MAKKKPSEPEAAPMAAAPTPPAMMPGLQSPGLQPPGMQPPGMYPAGAQPGMYPPAMPGMMPGAMPGQMPGAAMPGMQPNFMLGMMQMMQTMMGGMGGMPVPGVDPSAVPFSGGPVQRDADPGLDAGIIRPALFTNRIKTQAAVPLGSVLDLLCLTEDAKHALGGIPQGCTIAFAGPPGKGKTRSALAGLARVAARGDRVAFVVAEEGFHDEVESGRDDLCSRLCKVGIAATGMDEKKFTKEVLDRMFVLECQYHKGTSWDDFVGKYRYLVEKEQIKFVVIDSLNMLDPSRNRTADNLSALKTYNHEKGLTCLCLGQIRDTGQPVGGEALMHTADCVFLLEEMSMGSKEIADMWGAKYRDKIDVITCIKSVTTPQFQYPIRVAREPGTGVLVVHDGQPADYKPLPVK